LGLNKARSSSGFHQFLKYFSLPCNFLKFQTFSKNKIIFQFFLKISKNNLIIAKCEKKKIKEKKKKALCYVLCDSEHRDLVWFGLK